MNLDNQLYQDTMMGRNSVESYCRSYMLSKQGTVDEVLLQSMVNTLLHEIYVNEITDKDVNKDFVNRFSTPTGGKCKDGQIEVMCNACHITTSHGSRSFWKHIRGHIHNNHIGFHDMIQKWNHARMDQFLEIASKGIDPTTLITPMEHPLLQRKRDGDGSSRSSKSVRFTRDDSSLYLALLAIDSFSSLSSIISPFTNALLQSTNSRLDKLTETELNGPILSHLEDVTRRFILSQLQDRAVTMVLEDFFYDGCIHYRICLSNGEVVFCWKWVRSEYCQPSIEFIASMIENERATLENYRVNVSSIATSNNQLMREIVDNELTKRQICLQRVPYTSFMIEDMFREIFAIPLINECWSIIKPINDFFCSHQKYMKLLIHSQLNFPPQRFNMLELSRWKHSAVLNRTGDSLLVETKMGKRVPLRELTTLDQFYEGYVEDESEMIQMDPVAYSTTTFPSTSPLFLINVSDTSYYTRFFVLLRFLEVYNAVWVSHDILKKQCTGVNESCIDAIRLKRLSLRKETFDVLTNLVSFLFPFIQVLEYSMDISCQQTVLSDMMRSLSQYMSQETFTCIKREDIERILINRSDVYNDIPSALLSIVNDSTQRFRVENDGSLSPEFNKVLNAARYEAYGVFHGSFDNYDNPQQENEKQDRIRANVVREELIGYVQSFSDRIGLDPDRYISHSPYVNLNLVMKRIRGKATSVVERNFFSFKKEELQLCSQQRANAESISMLRVKGTLSCLSDNPFMIEKYIQYLQNYQRTRDYYCCVFKQTTIVLSSEHVYSTSNYI